jgi:hypothetical protein
MRVGVLRAAAAAVPLRTAMLHHRVRLRRWLRQLVLELVLDHRAVLSARPGLLVHGKVCAVAGRHGRPEQLPAAAAVQHVPCGLPGHSAAEHESAGGEHGHAEYDAEPAAVVQSTGRALLRPGLQLRFQAEPSATAAAATGLHAEYQNPAAISMNLNNKKNTNMNLPTKKNPTFEQRVIRIHSILFYDVSLSFSGFYLLIFSIISVFFFYIY